MNSKLRFIAVAAGVMVSFAAWSQMTLPPSGNNQRSEVTQYLGMVKVTINYSSPDVAGREIWGKLVPYGLSNQNFLKSTEQNPSPWRAGANETTTISFSHDVEIEGKPLKAGTYGFLLIPGQEDWTVVFSSNTMEWGSYSYVPSEDVLRVNVKSVPAEFNEWLTYEFTDRQQNSATAAMKWEKIAVPFKITVPNGDDLYVQRLRSEMTSNKGFNWINGVSAANFCATKKINLPEAEGWMQGFIDRGVKYFPIYNAKANVQAAAGKQAEADATMKEAIALPDATAGQIVNYGRQLIRQSRPKDATAVMDAAAKRFPGNATAMMGQAYAFDANGDKKNALKFAQNAAKTETNAQIKPQFEAAVAKLNKGESINQ
jgi:hypothetical protein